jgi:membrane-associated phospholipid phosphatase
VSHITKNDGELPRGERARWAIPWTGILKFLGSRLGIGFVVAVLALAFFGKLTEDVVNAEAVTKLDAAVHAWVRLRATDFGYGFFGVITTLGSPPALTLLSAVGLAVFLRQRRRGLAIAWTVTFLGGALLDAALKLLVHRPRPDTASDFLARLSWSYPSGHSMMSLVTFGMIAWALVRLRYRAALPRVLIVLAAAGMTFLVGLSRIYLGVHYFSDVIAGYTAGLIWLMAGVSAMERLRGAAPAAAGDAPTSVPPAADS